MTTNIEISDMIEKLHIPNFRGVIMRDEFKKLGKPWETEYGIYNLEGSNEDGSHWVMWAHRNEVSITNGIISVVTEVIHVKSLLST